MKGKKEQDAKVGVFVTIGLAFAMVAILVLGGTESAFTEKVHFRAKFQNANGLIEGAKVVLSGVPVGSVTSVDIEPDTHLIAVTFTVAKQHRIHIREGSTVEVNTQGVLGDKYLGINPGDGANELPENAEIPNLPSQDLAKILSKSDELLVNLSSAAHSLDQVLKSLNKGNRLDNIMANLNKFSSDLGDAQVKKVVKDLGQITEKINNGTGSLGALVNDPGLYDDARALVGGANRNRIIRNLVRKTAKEAGEKEK